MKTENSTEDDTYKRLRGLTFDEVDRIVERVVQDSNGEVSINVLRDRADAILVPYGWTFDKFFALKAFEGNIS